MEKEEGKKEKEYTRRTRSRGVRRMSRKRSPRLVQNVIRKSIGLGGVWSEEVWPTCAQRSSLTMDYPLRRRRRPDGGGTTSVRLFRRSLRHVLASAGYAHVHRGDPQESFAAAATSEAGPNTHTLKPFLLSNPSLMYSSR